MGGLTPFLLITLNRSVRQFVAPLATKPPPTVVMVAPLRKAVSVSVAVEGPVIEKVSKSSLICKKLSTLQSNFSSRIQTLCVVIYLTNVVVDWANFGHTVSTFVAATFEVRIILRGSLAAIDRDCKQSIH